MKLQGAKVRYRLENFRNRASIKQLAEKFKGHDNYPFSYQSGEWFTIGKVSGEFFDFEGTKNIGIIPYTMKEFSNNEWEWSFV